MTRSEYNQAIGRAIVRLRTERNLLQRQLADLVLVHQSVISKWELGTGMTLYHARALAASLGVSIDDLDAAAAREHRRLMRAKADGRS